MLDQLASYLERDLEARRKIKSAMIYPAVIAVMSLVTVVVLAGFVLPKFKVFFASLDAKLPLPTRMLLAVTDFLAQWWWAARSAASPPSRWSSSSRCAPSGGRYARDRLLLAMPVLGETIQFALVERFCRMLASMVGAGVPCRRRCESPPSRCATSSSCVRWPRSARRCSKGEGLAAPLAGPGCSRPPPRR